jgi:hypothetical protein
MWTQTLLSKKNRSLRNDIARGQDEFHFLNDAPPHTKPAMRSLNLSTKRHRIKDILLFIERHDDRIYCGAQGEIGFVLGADHPFSREADLHGVSLGREITFLHAYDHAHTDGLVVPDIASLLERQKADLLHILTEAHQGKEPVPVLDVHFEIPRRARSPWHEIAEAVESGACRGGFFSKQGELLETIRDPVVAQQRAERRRVTADLDERIAQSADEGSSIWHSLGSFLARKLGMGTREDEEAPYEKDEQPSRRGVRRR